MNPYREPPPPLESDHVVFLPPALGERGVRSRLFTYVVYLPLAFAVPPLVRALAYGGGDWTLLGWVAVLPLLPFVLTRGRLRGGILIGARSIRRLRFSSERVTPWERLADAQREREELERAQLFVRDRSGMLGWALDAARDGRFAELAERVHAEGRSLRRWRWYVPEAVGLLAVVLLVSVRPALAVQREAAWAQRRAEVAACMASISGTDPTREAQRTLCLLAYDTP